MKPGFVIRSSLTRASSRNAFMRSNLRRAASSAAARNAASTLASSLRSWTAACSIRCSACRPEIICVLPGEDRAAQDGHPIVDRELASPLLADHIALDDPVVVLVAAHLLE